MSTPLWTGAARGATVWRYAPRERHAPASGLHLLRGREECRQSGAADVFEIRKRFVDVLAVVADHVADLVGQGFELLARFSKLTFCGQPLIVLEVPRRSRNQGGRISRRRC